MLLTIEVDHSYSKHWSQSYLTNTSHVLSLKKLLDIDEEHHGLKPGDRSSKSSWERKYRSDNGSTGGSDEEIDVCEVEDGETRIGSSSWHCAEQKARSQMNECERQVTSTSKHAASHLRQDCESYWEDNVEKSHWNATETKLFNKAIKILNGEQLARLAYRGNSQDIVLRRLSVDRSSARLRSTLVDVGWKVKLTQWLHGLLMDKLPPSLLSCYLDIMQTLRSKVPTLIERMIMPSRDSGGASSERLGMLLKRPWDPAVTSVVSDMKQKLAHSVLFIVVQCTGTQSSIPATSWRLRFWNTLLSQVGKVIQVTAPSEDGDESTEDKKSQTVADLARRSFKTICRKVKDISGRHPHRKVVLIGWHTSSILNCHVALKEEVSAVVCLGFPLFTMFGKRGAIDDVLCDLTTPTLFVTGDRASFCDVNDLEDAREVTFTDAVTSAVVVGGADDWLRVSENRKRKSLQTQCMVDRKILEEICDFLHTIFQPACERKESFWSSAGCENSLSRKRPFSTGDIHGANNFKRQRSSSPLVTPQRHSTNSAQFNQLLSNQKKATEQGGSSTKLQGLFFDLQTGSISGLSSVPTSSSEITRSLSTGALSLPQRSSTPTKWKNKLEPQSTLSRSITIDLTKDPNAQLSSAMSKRTSQLLQPTESQTEAAVAAILGGDVGTNTTQDNDPANDQTITSTATPAALSSSQTAIMSPSTSLGRYASSNIVRIASTTCGGKSTATSTESRFSLTLGASIGNISSKSVTSSGSSGLKTGFKPVRSGLGRFNSVDQASVIASRSRKDDRETQQATAILEQLTSSLDSGMAPESRSNSPESFASEYKSRAGRPPRRGSLSSHRGDRHSFDSSATRYARTVSTVPHSPAGRVRTRGSRRGSRNLNQPTRPTTPATRKVNTSTGSVSTAKSVVRYVLTSSGLKGITSGGRGDEKGSRHVAVIPEQKGSSSSPTMISTNTTHRIFTPTSRKNVPRISETSGQQRQSPLNELMLHSVSSSTQTKFHKITGKVGSPSATASMRSLASKPYSKPQSSASGFPSTRPQQPKPTGNHSVIYPRSKAHSVTHTVQQLPTIVKQQTLLASSSKAIGTLVARKHGDRALLSITRPRAVSAGAPQTAKILSVTRSTSDATPEKSKSASMKMPSLVLTKISGQSQDSNDKSTL